MNTTKNVPRIVNYHVGDEEEQRGEIHRIFSRSPWVDAMYHVYQAVQYKREKSKMVQNVVLGEGARHFCVFYPPSVEQRHQIKTL